MEMPKLKPCPFCGNENLLFHAVEYDPCNNVISCNQCHMSFDMPTYVAGKKSNNRERVIETWNARASGWIPCSERMPEDGQEVLIITLKSKAVRFVRYNKTYNLFDIIGGFGTVGTYAVIHWMPLPEPLEEV